MAASSGISALHRDWEDALCPICLEHPHNAVLLLCSSHDKGCRSYVCDTSYRLSNCLDRFKEMQQNDLGNTHGWSSSHSARENVDLQPHAPSGPTIGVPILEFSIVGTQESQNHDENSTQVSIGVESNEQAESNSDVSNLNMLVCPLCRGNVKNWKVVREARRCLDEKSRLCSVELCTFSGNYRQLRRHARDMHPAIRPTHVEPSRRQAWNQLVRRSEYGDFLGAIRSAMHGASFLEDSVSNSEDLVLHNPDGAEFQEVGLLLSTILWYPRIYNSVPESRRSSRDTTRSRRRYLWGENLLGLQCEDDDDANSLGSNWIPRRRQRLLGSGQEDST